MGFEMSPQTVEYVDYVKICGSKIEVGVARGGWNADEARERNVEDLRAGREEVVEDRKGKRVREQRVIHEHERCHGWKICVE